MRVFHTDPKGQIKTLSYNKDDSLSAVAYSGTAAAIATPSVSFTYDTIYNRPLTRTDGLGSTALAYIPVGTNGAGNLLSEDGPLSGVIDKIIYTYDVTGRLKQTQIGSTNIELSTFDSLGRSTSVHNTLGTFGMTYVGQTSRIQQLIYPNGQRTHYDYFNAAGSHRLQTISNIRDAGAVNYLSRQEYTYTPDGNIASWKQGTGSGTSAGITASSTYSFGYDLTDQLTSVIRTNDAGGSVLEKFNYSYDAMGNRTNTQKGNTVTGYISNAANQTTATTGSGKMVVEGTLNEPAKVTVSGIPAGGQDLKYRAEVPVVPGANTFSITAEDYSPNNNSITRNWAINITGGTASSPTYDANGNTLDDGVRRYEWDAENRLIKITRGVNIWEFQYDGASRRVAEKKNSVMSRRWTWLGTRIAEQLNAAGTATVVQYHGMGEKRLSGPSGNFFYTRDHLGSVREITNVTGTLQARLEYDPYGDVTQTGSFPCQWGFTGHYYDPQIGLHLTLFRAYDQNRGKWLSTDPIREEGGINLYGYCENNPVKHTDPLGLDIWIQSSGWIPGHLEIAIGNPKKQFFTYSLIWAISEGLDTGVIEMREGRPGKIVKGHYAQTTEHFDRLMTAQLIALAERTQKDLNSKYYITHKNCRGWAYNNFESIKMIAWPGQFQLMENAPEQSEPGTIPGL